MVWIHFCTINCLPLVLLNKYSRNNQGIVSRVYEHFPKNHPLSHVTLFARFFPFFNDLYSTSPLLKADPPLGNKKSGLGYDCIY